MNAEWNLGNMMRCTAKKKAAWIGIHAAYQYLHNRRTFMNLANGVEKKQWIKTILNIGVQK